MVSGRARRKKLWRIFGKILWRFFQIFGLSGVPVSYGLIDQNLYFDIQWLSFSSMLSVAVVSELSFCFEFVFTYIAFEYSLCLHYYGGVEEVVKKIDSSQLHQDIQDTQVVIKPENTSTHPLEASPPSPQFECPYCAQRFPNQSELIVHMDKESADARQQTEKV
jgi:hypothetical protein